ncbi:MAG TPA: methyltetrahydrofolate--corrinoid methyltransferase [Eggerthellaceae bacterium]|nr:methyltetrahydrofolate--corrinoid methyltransferase [Eggerthellaceae bacterium]
MIIIGEKINGFIKKTLAAIESKDEEYLKELAIKQTESGAAFIDICAGTSVEIEKETLTWLINLVQDTVDTPICVDSSDPNTIIEMLPLVKKPGLINSISKEEGKCETVLPVIADTEWSVVALTCDVNGIPDDPKEKLRIAKEIVADADALGIAHERLYIDPLVATLASKPESFVSFSEAVRLIRAEFPDIHITSGLSNISFGMPYRKALNMQFLSLAMAAGMDSAIIDPTSPDMLATMYASAALLGNDPRCRQYLRAYKKGLFPVKPN